MVETQKKHAREDETVQALLGVYRHETPEGFLFANVRQRSAGQLLGEKRVGMSGLVVAVLTDRWLLPMQPRIQP